MTTLDNLLALEVGQNCAVHVRIGPPVGPVRLPEGREGELITLDGDHIAWMVPGTVKEIKGTGFGNSATRVYAFRALIEEGDRRVLVSGRVASVVGLANVKRMVDRDNPTARDAPRHAYADKRARYRRARQSVAKDFDYEDTGEI